MEGGSDLTVAAPFPLYPLDPLDPLMNSKNVVFIVRVVILGLDGALALCFFFFHFFIQPRVNHLLLGPKTQNLHGQSLENSPDFAQATVQLRISLRISWD